MKDFVKSWARKTLTLVTVQPTVLNELSKEPGAAQQLQKMYQPGGELASDDARKKVAFELALAEYAAVWTGLNSG